MTAGRHEVTGGYFHDEIAPRSGKIAEKKIIEQPMEVGKHRKRPFHLRRKWGKKTGFDLVESEVSKNSIKAKEYRLDGKMLPSERVKTRMSRDAIQNELDLTFY